MGPLGSEVPVPVNVKLESQSFFFTFHTTIEQVSGGRALLHIHRLRRNKNYDITDPAPHFTNQSDWVCFGFVTISERGSLISSPLYSIFILRTGGWFACVCCLREEAMTTLHVSLSFSLCSIISPSLHPSVSRLGASPPPSSPPVPHSICSGSASMQVSQGLRGIWGMERMRRDRPERKRRTKAEQAQAKDQE